MRLDSVPFLFPVSKIRLDKQNENDHPPEQIESLALSLEIFGQQKPIVLDKRNVCIAGEGVLTAAKWLGWPEIECERCELVGPDREAFRLADNTIRRRSEWNIKLMAANLVRMEEELGPKFKWLAIGLTPDEIAAIKYDHVHPARAEKTHLTIKITNVKGKDRNKVLRITREVLAGTNYEAKAY